MEVAESQGLKSLSEVESDPAGSAAPQGLNQRLRALLSFRRRIHPSAPVQSSNPWQPVIRTMSSVREETR